MHLNALLANVQERTAYVLIPVFDLVRNICELLEYGVPFSHDTQHTLSEVLLSWKQTWHSSIHGLELLCIMSRDIQGCVRHLIPVAVYGLLSACSIYGMGTRALQPLLTLYTPKSRQISDTHCGPKNP